MRSETASVGMTTGRLLVEEDVVVLQVQRPREANPRNVEVVEENVCDYRES